MSPYGRAHVPWLSVSDFVLLLLRDLGRILRRVSLWYNATVMLLDVALVALCVSVEAKWLWPRFWLPRSPADSDVNNKGSIALLPLNPAGMTSLWHHLTFRILPSICSDYSLNFWDKILGGKPWYERKLHCGSPRYGYIYVHLLSVYPVKEIEISRLTGLNDS